jgi:hypothetical protein
VRHEGTGEERVRKRAAGAIADWGLGFADLAAKKQLLFVLYAFFAVKKLFIQFPIAGVGFGNTLLKNCAFQCHWNHAFMAFSSFFRHFIASAFP